jgi:hypothetical protein
MGFGRQKLDVVLDAGWWDAGEHLDLIARGVNADMAVELDSQMVKVFTPTHRQEG